MKIINNNTPTSEIAEVKVGDTISNGLGTFGKVDAIKFNDEPTGWHFTFALVGGGFIEAKKERASC